VKDPSTAYGGSDRRFLPNIDEEPKIRGLATLGLPHTVANRRRNMHFVWRREKILFYPEKTRQRPRHSEKFGVQACAISPGGEWRGEREREWGREREEREREGERERRERARVGETNGDKRRERKRTGSRKRKGEREREKEGETPRLRDPLLGRPAGKD